jgi:hypothetical protein
VEAHQRHVETTPSGVSHHRGDSDMGDLPHRVKDDPRYFTADVHITPDGRARIGNHTYSAEEYADMLRRSGWDGKKPIRLIGCDAGSNDFAKQLSRHLDAPVLAPNKPAWTDSHGRVFTSDAEVDAHGNRQPKIPPNGEWETHHPDGTKTKASDDGFVPGTHDHDKHDLDPHDARDRAPRPIPGDPVGIEDRKPKALMEEKLKDKDYRGKYYYGPDKNGEYSRKNANQRDFDRDDVPKLRENPPGSGNFERAPEDFIPANYREDIPTAKPEATPAQKKAAQDIVERRAAANERVKTADENYKKATSGGGEASPETVEERRAAHHERTGVGEELGEHAATDAVNDMFPADKFDVTPKHGTESGSGRFDQIYEVHDKKTGETRVVIVEAKGPSAELGVRKGLDGNAYQQGHPKYVESIIDNMLKNGTDAEKALAPDLAKAMLKQKLDYIVVKARVNGSEYGGYTRNQFDLA